ncbi:MAG: hypothetical protein M3282_05595 [Gemmatimonadota bacterium]|nr:hypothetical protein [Gemmatimonadota bacterium]
MIARIRRFALAAFAATTAAVAASPLGAQQPSQVPASDGPAARHQAVAPAGPTLDRAAVGVRPLTQETDSLTADPFAQQRRAGLGRPAALMVVGFGAMIVGLIIGDDVGTLVAIAGAAIGLYGLYHYLK